MVKTMANKKKYETQSEVYVRLKELFPTEADEELRRLAKSESMKQYNSWRATQPKQSHKPHKQPPAYKDHVVAKLKKKKKGGLMKKIGGKWETETEIFRRLLLEQPDTKPEVLRALAKSQYKANGYKRKKRLEKAAEKKVNKDLTEHFENRNLTRTNGQTNGVQQPESKLYKLYDIPESASRKNVFLTETRIKRVEPLLQRMRVGQAFSMENIAGAWMRKYLNETYPDRKYVVSTPKDKSLPAEVRYVADGSAPGVRRTHQVHEQD